MYNGHGECYKIALDEAKISFREGGVPVGSSLVKNDEIISRGHNKRVQENDPILHGEMDCIRNAGRLKSYKDTTLYTTLSPCMMCSGAIVQLKIPRVVIGENKNFHGNVDFLEKNGVCVEILNDEESIQLMEKFIKLNKKVWEEDISE